MEIISQSDFDKVFKHVPLDKVGEELNKFDYIEGVVLYSGSVLKGFTTTGKIIIECDFSNCSPTGFPMREFISDHARYKKCSFPKDFVIRSFSYIQPRSKSEHAAYLEEQSEKQKGE
jgi:hypothetical protein